MTYVEWVTISLWSTIIVFIVLCLFFFFRTIFTKREIKTVPKKKKKTYSHKKKLLKNYKKKSIVFLLISILITFGLFGFKYYHSFSLTKNEKENIVNSYFLLSDFEKQIKDSKSNNKDVDAIKKNIRYLGTAMASYGVKSASTSNSEEGQKLLNRYYNSIKELGINASAHYNKIFEDKDLSLEYLKDIEKVKKKQYEVLKFYRIDDSALKKRE